MKKASIFFLFFFFSAFLCSTGLICEEQKKGSPFQIKDVLTIEKDLLELINKERKKSGLCILRLSQDLNHLARQHSQDMASLRKLSHFSSSGKSYEERLVEAGFYYISMGENVAFSDSFLSEFIHQNLMESPEHRKNILNPSFGEIGIGVIFVENKGYYITQDFIQSLEIKGEEIVKAEIQEKINSLRRKNSLSPLIFLKEANAHAREFSQKKAEEKPPSASPSHFGENHIIYVSSPSLEEAQSVYQHKILDRIYENAGLSVSFRRNKEYPGGSYFITLILFPENKYKYMDKEDLRQIIFQNSNKLRQKKGLDKFKLDNRLTNSAERVLGKIIAHEDYSSIFPTRSKEAAFIFFITVDPTALSREAKNKIENDLIHFRKIGIGISFSKTREYPRGAFWVAILSER